jgi:hypothetical protein
MMNRIIRRVSVSLLGIVGAAQFVQPQRTNPPVPPDHNLWTDARVDSRVGGILRRACADCHSHETTWPWYAQVSPISWFLALHVERGRAKLNFSDWSGPSSDQLEEIYTAIRKEKMPLASYTLLHPDARLSKADRDVLKAWADGTLADNSPGKPEKSNGNNQVRSATDVAVKTSAGQERGLK